MRKLRVGMCTLMEVNHKLSINDENQLNEKNKVSMVSTKTYLSHSHPLCLILFILLTLLANLYMLQSMCICRVVEKILCYLKKDLGKRFLSIKHDEFNVDDSSNVN